MQTGIQGGGVIARGTEAAVRVKCSRGKLGTSSRGRKGGPLRGTFRQQISKGTEGRQYRERSGGGVCETLTCTDRLPRRLLDVLQQIHGG